MDYNARLFVGILRKDRRVIHSTRNDISCFEMPHSPRDNVELNPKSVHYSKQCIE